MGLLRKKLAYPPGKGAIRPLRNQTAVHVLDLSPDFPSPVPADRLVGTLLMPNLLPQLRILLNLPAEGLLLLRLQPAEQVAFEAPYVIPPLPHSECFFS